MFRKLLVPLDRSELAEQALGPAAAIARASHATVDLVLVHQPIPFGGFDDAPWNAATVEEDSKYLAALAVELATGADLTPTYAVARGEAVEMIAERAREREADLIVMTSHGRTGASRVWMGSVADAVIRNSAIPVLMLRAAPGAPAPRAPTRLFKRILVTLDGSARAREIIPAAAALADASDAQVLLLKVVLPVPGDEVATKLLVDEARIELDKAVQELASAGVQRGEPHVVVAEQLARAILDFATHHGIDAIAMATSGRGASRVIVGSIADKVIRATTLPMLMVRPIGQGGRVWLDAKSVADQLPALMPS
jgi:nucleotide-binding universal stress UspA family protein